MRASSTVYLDVEAYNSADTACGAVLASTQSFNRALKARSYRPGFYGFAGVAAGGDAAVQRKPAGSPQRRRPGPPRGAGPTRRPPPGWRATAGCRRGGCRTARRSP
ncbi:glycoside hydrolase domain-containing protein [Streptomyces sp. NRRL B-24484]|uniref:glycoside hydrolase domain-containing protein n=1 Tax=Streptomyces sp. NRRL B-24484 TaxID=1463833 RepID=UPI003B632718